MVGTPCAQFSRAVPLLQAEVRSLMWSLNHRSPACFNNHPWQPFRTAPPSHSLQGSDSDPSTPLFHREAVGIHGRGAQATWQSPARRPPHHSRGTYIPCQAQPEPAASSFRAPVGAPVAGSRSLSLFKPLRRGVRQKSPFAQWPSPRLGTADCISFVLSCLCREYCGPYDGGGVDDQQV